MKVFASQIVDKTIMEADLDKDGKISFEEFKKKVENTDVSMSMTLGKTCFPKTTGRNMNEVTDVFQINSNDCVSTIRDTTAS